MEQGRCWQVRDPPGRTSAKFSGAVTAILVKDSGVAAAILAEVSGSGVAAAILEEVSGWGVAAAPMGRESGRAAALLVEGPRARADVCAAAHTSKTAVATIMSAASSGEDVTGK